MTTTTLHEPLAHANRTAAVSYVILAIWFLTVLLFSLMDGFVAHGNLPPLGFVLGILLPLTLFYIAYVSLESFRSFVLNIDLRVLVLLHSWRTVGLGFVFLYFQDKLPALFALPAGLGDATVAIWALLLGVSMYRGKFHRKQILVWNSFGLADFILAVSLGIVSGTAFLGSNPGIPSSAPMEFFPLALIPGFFVPAYMLTHIIIYLQISKLDTKDMQID